MTMRDKVKSLYFKISPSFRRTQYLLDAASRLETAFIDNISNLESVIAARISALEKADAENKRLIKDCLEAVSELRPKKELFSDHYEYWRAKRITAIVEHYGESWFKGKKILELGAGHGDIGYVLTTLGAKVIFAEGREDNCQYLRRRFNGNDVYRMNCENEWPFPPQSHFDLILHMGLLYHLDNIWFVLDKALECSDHLVLETEVADSDDPDYILKIEEDSQQYDQSLIGHGSRPSAEYIEKHLTEMNWNFKRVTDARCNALFHKYDWPVKNTGTWKSGQRRFWFCEKNKGKN